MRSDEKKSSCSMDSTEILQHNVPSQSRIFGESWIIDVSFPSLELQETSQMTGGMGVEI